MSISLSLEERCHLAVKCIEILWDIENTDIDTLISAINTIIINKLFSIEYMLSFLDNLAFYRLKMISSIATLVRFMKVSKSLEIKIQNFPNSRYLQIFLVKANIIEGFMNQHEEDEYADFYDYVIRKDLYPEIWDDIENFSKKFYFEERDPSYLKTTARYGSIKCFKFLLINGYKPNSSILEESSKVITLKSSKFV